MRTLIHRDAFLETVIDALRRGDSISLRVTGASMSPWLPEGTRVRIAPTHNRRILPGDILLYRRQGQRFILHRALHHRRSAQGWSTWRCRGDAEYGPPETVPGAEVLGVVVSAEIFGRTRRLASPSWRCIGRAWQALGPVRPLVMTTAWRLRRRAQAVSTGCVRWYRWMRGPCQPGTSAALAAAQGPAKPGGGAPPSSRTSPRVEATMADPLRVCACALGLADGPIPIPSCDAEALLWLSWAERHRLLSLLAKGLAPQSAYPPQSANPWSEALRRRLLSRTRHDVRLERALGRILSCWAERGLDSLVLKGPALARQAYDDPGLRVYDDLDFWVPTECLDAAVAALVELGYHHMYALSPRQAACARRAGIEVALYDPSRTLLVEISHGPPFPSLASGVMDDVRRQVVPLSIEGHQARTPCPVHALLLSCAHGAHHAWDRWGWVADVAGLWSRLTPEARHQAIETARRWHATTLLGLGLALAAQAFSLPLDPAAARLTQRKRVVALLRRWQLWAVTNQPDRATTAQRRRFERQAIEGFPRRLRCFAAWVFTPSIGDIDIFPLPPAAMGLYPLLRPLRGMIRVACPGVLPRPCPNRLPHTR